MMFVRADGAALIIMRGFRPVSFDNHGDKLEWPAFQPVIMKLACLIHALEIFCFLELVILIWKMMMK